MGLEWITFARTGMINVSSAALKGGDQGVSLERRKNQVMEKLRELNPWENITGRQQRGRKQLVGAETVVDQYHRFGPSLSGFLVVEVASDDVNWRWKDSGRILLVGTFVGSISLVDYMVGRWFIFCLCWGTLRQTQQDGSSMMAWPLRTCSSRFAMQQKQQQSLRILT